MKKILTALLALVLAFSFTACGEKDGTSKKIKVGVIQYMSHPSLDNCYNGVKAALDGSGIEYTLDFQVGSSGAADTDCTTFAKNMVAENCDIIIAIATPAAKSAFAATDNTDIPVIFCAVSDPVAAKLVESMDAPGYPCTGTSDLLDLSAQLDLIKGFQPDVKKIGILYTSSEENSISNLNRFTEICSGAGVEVVPSAVQNANDIPAAADELASKVDCINNFTDNNVVNNLNVLLDAAEKYGIPVYGSEEEQVKNGCIASVSIDYFALGKVTGQMAVDVLNGSDAAKMPVKTIKDATPVINKAAIENLGMSVPAQYAEAANVG